MKKKEIVFIDTCIYISENYFCSGNRIQTLADLAKDGVISLISTEITNKEIIAHLTRDSMVSYNSLRHNYEVLKNFEDESLFEKKERENIAELAKIKVKKFLDNAHVLNLGYEYCNDVTSVFDKYFSEERPFHEGNKKYEFPDAFVLSALEKYCSKFNIKILVLSNDTDLLKYKSEFLTFDDYKKFITRKIAEKDLLKRIKESIDSEESAINVKLGIEFRKVLHNKLLYYEAVHYQEIDNINVEKYKVKIDKSSFNIISKIDSSYMIEIKANANYKAKLHYFDVNENNAYYNLEDGQCYGGEWKYYNVDESISFTFRLKYNDSLRDENIIIDKFDIVDVIGAKKYYELFQI